MPGTDGMDLLRQVRERLPWIPVLMVTGYGDVPLAVQAVKNGAVDFVEKPLDRDAFLLTVQRLVERNARPAALLAEFLTKTERKIFYLIVGGKNNREIADVLHCSPRTVEVHRSHLMQKLEATNITELLRRAAQMGLLASPSTMDRMGEPFPAPRASGTNAMIPDPSSCLSRQENPQ